MKELYLGLVVVAFILLILSITVEASLSGNGQVVYSYNNEPESNKTVSVTERSISDNELKNTFPERAYNEDNLNKVFLQKYYNNKYFNDINSKNKFYMPN